MIRVRRDGAVATIALDRADARNALSTAGWRALTAAIRDLTDGDIAVVVLASDVPGIFCAGADLSDLGPLTTDIAGRAAFRERMAAAIEGIAALPMPTIAAVDGGCWGAGVALALACDLIVAGEGAVFATTPAKLGIGYPPRDVARLRDRVGRSQAARMLFSAQPVDADEALRIGLADLRGDAGTIVAQIASNAASAVRLLKRMLDGRAGDADFDAAFGGADFAERLAAFRGRAR